MREITCPDPVALTTTHDKPVLGDTGQPLVIDMQAFLLGRIADPAFSGERTGLDAALFAYETKAALDAQRGASVLRLENDQWRQLCAAARATRYDPRFAHCLVPLLRALLDAREASP